MSRALPYGVAGPGPAPSGPDEFSGKAEGHFAGLASEVESLVP